MKTTRVVLTLLTFILVIPSYATIWRVNSNPKISADFHDLQEAIDHFSVEDGDTLYLENGSYFGVTVISKPLTIIGPGYFLTENEQTYAHPFPANIQQLSVNSNGSGSKIIGVQIVTGFSLGADANDVIIERSKMSGVGPSHAWGIGVAYNLTIRNCYIAGGGISDHNASSGFNASTIHNNIILGRIYFQIPTANHNIYNNVIWHSNNDTNFAITAANSSVHNNIIIRTPFSRAEQCINFDSPQNNNSTFVRNVMTQSPHASSPDNIWNVVKEDVFVLQASTDKRWKLKEGSPAIGYGSNGDDCGAYGGVMPYVPSGLPMLLPRIFEATIPASGSGNMIPVHIKAKTQE